MDFLHLGLILFGEQLPAAVLFHLVELDQFFDTSPNDCEVRQQAAEPALVDIAALATVGRVADDILGLFLRPDKEDVVVAVGNIADELEGLFEMFDCFLQVDDINPVALAKNILLHLRVPALRLMAEMDPSL